MLFIALTPAGQPRPGAPPPSGHGQGETDARPRVGTDARPHADIDGRRARCGLRVAGLTPFTTIDYPGKLSAVVFVQGCPWRCGYCHNPHLQPRATPAERTWADTLNWLERRAGLIDAVVFSGGEPTIDPALPAAMADARRLGFAVGLHSAGVHARRLQAVLPLADWVGLDVKAPLDDPAAYARITGVNAGVDNVIASLRALVASGVAHEVRTTIHPSWLDDAALLRLGQGLAAHGIARWTLQIARATEHCPLPTASDYPAPDTLARLDGLFEHVGVRRD